MGQAVGGGVDLGVGSPDVFVNQGGFIGKVFGAGFEEMMDEGRGIHWVLFSPQSTQRAQRKKGPENQSIIVFSVFCQVFLRRNYGYTILNYWKSINN